MEISLFTSANTQEVVALFTDVFSASEGEAEGQLIGKLVLDLINTTAPKDIIGFVAKSDDRIDGCIFFSRFIVPNHQTAYLLSPVAIATQRQGSGIGQTLITYGLNHLKTQHVDLVFTYGDPRFYFKTGFKQINESTVEPPFPLSQPEGWLAQSLHGTAIGTMKGATRCVAALSDQGYW